MIEFSGYKHSDYPDVFVLEVMGHIDTEEIILKPY